MRRASRAGRDDETVGHEAAQARELIEPVIERLREVGLLNDQAFAATRATRLSTGGRSRRAIRAHLNDKGIDAATVRTVTTSDTTSDFHAAIAFAKRRRLGPFARQNDEALTRDARRSAENKALGAMARAGFDFDICTRVLRLSLEDASLLLQERRGPF
jgi:regulatory protein